MTKIECPKGTSKVKRYGISYTKNGKRYSGLAYGETKAQVKKKYSTRKIDKGSFTIDSGIVVDCR